MAWFPVIETFLILYESRWDSIITKVCGMIYTSRNKYMFMCKSLFLIFVLLKQRPKKINNMHIPVRNKCWALLARPAQMPLLPSTLNWFLSIETCLLSSTCTLYCRYAVGLLLLVSILWFFSNEHRMCNQCWKTPEHQ